MGSLVELATRQPAAGTQFIPSLCEDALNGPFMGQNVDFSPFDMSPHVCHIGFGL